MQVNQNVNAANFLLVSSQASNAVPSKEELIGSMGFADVLQNTSNQQVNNNPIDFSSEKDNAKVSAKDELLNDDMKTSSERESMNAKETENATTAKETSNATEMQDENVETNTKSEEKKIESEVVEKVDEAEVTQGVESTDGLSDEEMETILETIGNLLYEVMQQFGLSLEELSAKLEEFGMEPSDLLTQDGLKDFFLQMNGAEVSDLIVDENLNQQLQLFMSQISDDITTLETLIPDMETFVSDKDVAQMLSEVVTTQEEALDIPIVAESVDEVVVSDEPEVIVDSKQSTNMNSLNDNDSSSNSDSQQPKESLQQLSSQETVQTEQSTAKTNTFDNPILQAIQNAMNNVEATIVSEQQVQQTDILRQVVEQVRVNMNQQQTSMELQLYPEHLGRIQINVVSKEGVMTASIVAETEAAKQAIEAGLLNLKEAMEQQDLKVEAIEVMVSTMGFEQGEEQQQSFDEKGSSNPRRKIDLSELGEEIAVDDEAEIEKMKATGSSVSYRA